MQAHEAESGPTPTESIKGTVTKLFSIVNQFRGTDRSQARRYEIIGPT